MFKKVYSTKINVIANLLGGVWTSFLGIIFVPYYLNYINIESYGLIGVFTSVQAFILLLDFGISPTLNRELARLSTIENNAQEMRDLKRTLEVPNWICALFIALLLSALSPLIARFWIQPKDLSVETAMQALVIMSVNIAVMFSMNFYTGGLMGLQKQLLLSFINVVCGTLRSAGALAILVFVSSTIQAFLLWQGAVAILQLFLMAITLKISLPDAPDKGHFQKDLLRRVWRFAAGMTAISVVALILTQTDKIILSRMLNLEDFGYYTLALTVSGMTTGIVVSSINHAAFPQFSRLVSLGDAAALSEFYHRSCQVMSVFLFPIMIVFALFSYDILLIWIKKPEIAANTYLLLSLIAVGNGLNGSVWLPNTLQLAHGRTKPSFYLNLVSIFFLIPLIVFGVYQYGAVGAAAAWVVLNASYFITLVQITHRRILKGEQWKWYLEDIALPFIIAFLTAGTGKLLFPSNGTRIETVIGLAIVSAATLLATVFSTRATRDYLKVLKERFFGALKTTNLRNK